MRLSLRQRLLVYLLSGTLIVWLIAAFISTVRTRAEIEAQFDARLAQSALVIWSLLSHELLEEKAAGTDGQLMQVAKGMQELEMHLAEHRTASPIAFQIEARAGGLRFASAKAPAESLSDGTAGYTNAHLSGTDWRVFSYYDRASDMVIRTAEQHDVRAALVNEISWQLVIPLAIALPILGLLTWSSIGGAMRPLNDLANAVRSRDPYTLSEIEVGNVPSEALPLVASINRLLLRLERALTSERRFTSDAAHELRTPLAAIKTQAEVATRANDVTVRTQALVQVNRGVDRAIHLSRQMLALARVEPDSDPITFAHLHLIDVARVVTAELATAAARKGITLDQKLRSDAIVFGNAQALSVLARNLIDNAIRYTPKGGRVEIYIQNTDDGSAALVVADSGPGIPEAERPLVMKRFYRRRSERSPGSGLGLSIVDRISGLHGATFTLATSLSGGVAASVVFPAAAGIANS